MTKHRITQTLSSIPRKGMECVVSRLEEAGFFEAPASTKFHLSCKGGLAEHSWNTYQAALAIREAVIRLKPEIAPELPLESVAICALLHDVCKTDIYKRSIMYQGYTVDYAAGLPLGHGEKSVILLLSWGLELTREEMLAIRWHMNAWDLPLQSYEHKSSIDAAKSVTPLVTLIQTADGIAAGMLER